MISAYCLQGCFIVLHSGVWYNYQGGEDHYIASYGAESFPFGVPKHPYRIVVDSEAMKRIREEYTYEYYGIEEEI